MAQHGTAYTYIIAIWCLSKTQLYEYVWPALAHASPAPRRSFPKPIFKSVQNISVIFVWKDGYFFCVSRAREQSIAAHTISSVSVALFPYSVVERKRIVWRCNYMVSLLNAIDVTSFQHHTAHSAQTDERRCVCSNLNATTSFYIDWKASLFQCHEQNTETLSHSPNETGVHYGALAKPAASRLQNIRISLLAWHVKALCHVDI